MKILIAAACACVIAATGYYFVQEYRGMVAAITAANAAAIAAHRDDCIRMVQQGHERQDPRMISKGEHCMVGME